MSATRDVSGRDRSRAVWAAFKRAVEESPTADVMMPMMYRRARHGGRLSRQQFTLIRWHRSLRPWLYPDPNPFPRLRLWGRRRETLSDDRSDW